jgi:hypothetical protein
MCAKCIKKSTLFVKKMPKFSKKCPNSSRLIKSRITLRYVKIIILTNVLSFIIEMSLIVFHVEGIKVIFQIRFSNLVHCGLSVQLAELYVPITTNILRFNNPSKKGRVG